MDNDDTVSQNAERKVRQAKRTTSSLIGYGFTVFCLLVAAILLIVYYF